MTVAEDAKAAQGRVIRRSDRAAAAALRLWRQVDPANLDASWDAVGPRVEEIASAAVVSNARTSATVANRAARADAMTGDVLVPEAFSGVDASGRQMGSLLVGSVIAAKQAISAGMSIAEAMTAGGSYLVVALKSALADVERSSSLAAATGKGYVRYVRLVNPGACSRCAVLAGSDRFKTNFERHPACRCSTVPIRGTNEIPDGLYANPTEYFDSLAPAEQERVFTKAGAEAIRLGADPVKVVAARRGAKKQMTSAPVTRPSRLQRTTIGRRPDGTPIQGYVTVEGTSRRGTYGRAQERLGAATVRGTDRYSRTTRPRLMPESIIDLTDDPDMRRLLLRDAGYTIPPTNGSDWLRRMYTQQADDRYAADAFYRSLGIGVG
jgi:hypothetical protein